VTDLIARTHQGEFDHMIGFWQANRNRTGFAYLFLCLFVRVFVCARGITREHVICAFSRMSA